MRWQKTLRIEFAARTEPGGCAEHMGVACRTDGQDVIDEDLEDLQNLWKIGSNS